MADYPMVVKEEPAFHRWSGPAFRRAPCAPTSSFRWYGGTTSRVYPVLALAEPAVVVLVECRCQGVRCVGVWRRQLARVGLAVETVLDQDGLCVTDRMK